MTTGKDFKRVVRARMQKTGESYTAARAILLTPPIPRRTPAPAVAPPAVPPASAYPRLAGMSDAAVRAKTGCGWDRWVWALDRVKAHEWSHREIAAYVRTTYKQSSWWSQTVTVGYERIKGLREKGQRRDGGFEANKSRTLPVSVARLYRAVRDQRTRVRWMPEPALTVSSATPSKYLRGRWPDGTTIQFNFLPRGAGKSMVQVQHQRLPDKAAVARIKAYWTERLGALAGLGM